MTLFSARLGSANTFDNALRNLSSRQAGVANLQENLTSGKRVNRPSDDPTAAAQAERARTRMERIKADQRALESQRNTIAQAESTLGDVVTALQTIRELVVSAGNAGYTAEQRSAIAFQINGLRDQVFALSNRRDTNGMPLFSGLGSALEPFIGPFNGQAQEYNYRGLPGQTASSEFSIAPTLDGDSAFMHQPARDGVFNVKVSDIDGTRSLQTSTVEVADANSVTGASYQIRFLEVKPGDTLGTQTARYEIIETPEVSDPPFVAEEVEIANYPVNQPLTIRVDGMPGLRLDIVGQPATGDVIDVQARGSIFSVLDDAVRDIGVAYNNNDAVQAVGQALHNIDVGIGRVSAIRGQAGDLLTRVDRITANQEVRNVQLEADRSTAEDLDMIKGISDFQTQQTGLSAALQSYAQIQRLTLFNYIG